MTSTTNVTPNTTNASITRAVLEALNDASQSMKGWITIEMNDRRVLCTDGIDIWNADVGIHEPISDIDLMDEYVSIRFDDESVMWLYYANMVSASLTITGVN